MFVLPYKTSQGRYFRLGSKTTAGCSQTIKWGERSAKEGPKFANYLYHLARNNKVRSVVGGGVTTFLTISVLLYKRTLTTSFSGLIVVRAGSARNFSQQTRKVGNVTAMSTLHGRCLSRKGRILLMSTNSTVRSGGLMGFDGKGSTVTFVGTINCSTVTLNGRRFSCKRRILTRHVQRTGFPVLSTGIVMRTAGGPLAGSSIVCGGKSIGVKVVNLAAPRAIIAAGPGGMCNLGFLSSGTAVTIARGLIGGLGRRSGYSLVITIKRLNDRSTGEKRHSSSVLVGMGNVSVFVSKRSRATGGGCVGKTLLTRAKRCAGGVNIVARVSGG